MPASSECSSVSSFKPPSKAGTAGLKTGGGGGCGLQMTGKKNLATGDTYDVCLMKSMKETTGASRGVALWARKCQKCLDVKTECPLGAKCPTLRVVVWQKLAMDHLVDPPEGRDVKRMIEELAEDNVRAKQLAGKGGLKADSAVVNGIIFEWTRMLKIQKFIEETDETWDVKEEKDKVELATEFLKGVSGKDTDVGALVADLIPKQVVFLQFVVFKDKFMAEPPVGFKNDFNSGSLVVEAFFAVGVQDEKRGGANKRKPSAEERKAWYTILLYWFNKNNKD